MGLEELQQVLNQLYEKSFTQADIPDNFIMVFDINYDASVENLMNRKLDGVAGISGNANIIMDFLGVARDAMLLMDGQETVKLNKLSRVMYDNPNYLVSNGMEPLFRIWSKTMDREHGYDGVMQNFFDHMKATLKKKGYMDAEYGMSYSGAFYMCMGEQLFKDKPKFMNFGQFSKWMIRKMRSMTDYCSHAKRNKFYVDRVLEMTDSQLQEVMKETLLEIGRTYGSEGEWFIKDKSLKVPQKSKLFISIGFPEELMEPFKQGKEELEKAISELEPALREMVLRYQIGKARELREKVTELEKVYDIEFLDSREFDAMRSDLWTEEDYGKREAKLKARFKR